METAPAKKIGQLDMSKNMKFLLKRLYFSPHLRPAWDKIIQMFRNKKPYVKRVELCNTRNALYLYKHFRFLKPTVSYKISGSILWNRPKYLSNLLRRSTPKFIQIEYPDGYSKSAFQSIHRLMTVIPKSTEYLAFKNTDGNMDWKYVSTDIVKFIKIESLLYDTALDATLKAIRNNLRKIKTLSTLNLNPILIDLYDASGHFDMLQNMPYLRKLSLAFTKKNQEEYIIACGHELNKLNNINQLSINFGPSSHLHDDLLKSLTDLEIKKLELFLLNEVPRYDYLKHFDGKLKSLTLIFRQVESYDSEFNISILKSLEEFNFAFEGHIEEEYLTSYMIRLAQIISNFPNLNKLSLKSEKEYGLDLFFQDIEKIPKLKEFNVEAPVITQNMIAHMAEFLKLHPGLVTFGLNDMKPKTGSASVVIQEKFSGMNSGIMNYIYEGLKLSFKTLKNLSLKFEGFTDIQENDKKNLISFLKGLESLEGLELYMPKEFLSVNAINYLMNFLNQPNKLKKVALEGDFTASVATKSLIKEKLSKLNKYQEFTIQDLPEYSEDLFSIQLHRMLY